MCRAISRPGILHLVVAAAIATGALVHSLPLQASAQVCAYVTHESAGTVSIVNTDSKQVTATVPVGGSPTDVVILPAASRAYVTNIDPDSVTVIDTAAKAVSKTIDIAGCVAPLCGPETIALTTAGLRAYVPSPVDSGAHILSVINTATNTVATSPTVRAMAVPRGGGVGITPGGNLGCVTGYTLDPPGGAQPNAMLYLDVLNTDTNLLTHRNFPRGPAGNIADFLARAQTTVAVTPGGICYVTDGFKGTVLVVPTATNSIREIALVSMPPVPVPTGVAISPDGNFAYVSGGTLGTPPAVNKGQLFVIDTRTNVVTSAIQAGGHFFTDVALSPDGTFALVTDHDTNNVLVINTDPENLTVTGTIPVSSAARSVAIASVPNGCPVVSTCVGDCDNMGRVTVTQLLKMVNIDLGILPLSDCLAGDGNGDGRITISDIVKAVNNTLGSCPA